MEVRRYIIVKPPVNHSQLLLKNGGWGLCFSKLTTLDCIVAFRFKASARKLAKKYDAYVTRAFFWKDGHLGGYLVWDIE